MTLDTDKKIDFKISLPEIEKKLDLIFDSNLDDETKEFIKEALRSLVKIDQLVGAKETTIARLRKIFDKKSEKLPPKNPPSEKNKGKGGRKPGQGNLGVKDYPNAEKKQHPLSENLKAGQLCPQCKNALLLEKAPGIYIRIVGQPLAKAVVHETEKSECANCGAVFEAEFADKAKGKYDSSIVSLIAILHYLGSMPFYRFEKLQKTFITPMPRSVQWSLMEGLSKILFPIWKELQKRAREGVQFYSDDTTGKILSVMKEVKNLPEKSRKKIHTTGIISKLQDNTQVVLYFTGIKYSGENMSDLLQGRQSLLPIKLMSDALKQNSIKGMKDVIEFNCLTHGRRKFSDLEEKFKAETEYILDLISKVYKAESECKKQNLSGAERLSHHQLHSGPVMEEMKRYFEKCFSERLVEENSTLGKSIQYMLNHWEKLCGFLKYEDAPIDNNLLESELRTQVLNRKNWLFYKTAYGALVGDILSSILKTCNRNKIDCYSYLNFIQANANEIELAALHGDPLPEKFLPWNFTSQA